MNTMPVTTAPRWLALTMLPVLAAAALMVDMEVQKRAWDIGSRPDIREIAQAGELFGSLAGPFIVALLFCYPIARLYGRYASLAAVLIALPSGAYDVLSTMPQATFIRVLFATEALFLVLFMATNAWLARRALAGSRLALLIQSDAKTGDAANTLTPLAAPRKPMIVLLPFLAVAFFIVHDLVGSWGWDIAFDLNAGTPRRVGFLAAGLIIPTMVALVLAYPIARLYRRRAAAIAVLVSFPTVWNWSSFYLRHPPRSRYLMSGDAMEMVLLSVLVALAAWLIHRKLGDSRLVLVHDPAKTSTPP